MKVTKKCRCGRDLVCKASKGTYLGNHADKYFWAYSIKCECGINTGEHNSAVIAWKIANKMLEGKSSNV